MGKKRGKSRQKAKMNARRNRRRKMGKIVRFTLANATKKLRGISNCYAYQSNMHNLIFKGAQFTNVNYRASIITKCNYNNTNLTGIDFIYANLKGTTFKNAHLDNVIFFGVNLAGADFKNALFNNVVFINTNTTKAKNLNISQEGITILSKYPDFILNEDLQFMLFSLIEFNKIYKHRTLHVNKNKINKWFLYLLLQEFSTSELIRGFQALAKRKDKRHFYTLYSIKKFLYSYLKR